MLNDVNFSAYVMPLHPIPTSVGRQGSLREPVQSILFDIYGTLLISDSGDIGMAGEKTPKQDQLDNLLKKYGITMYATDVVSRLHQTIRARHSELRGSGVDFPEVEIDRIWETILPGLPYDKIRSFAIEFELIVNPIYPMPHLRKTLRACSKSGVILGIISNAQFYTPLLFEWFLQAGLRDMGFVPELTIFSFKEGRAKPSVALFERAAERLTIHGVKHASVLYVGNDMLNDMLPAKQVGFITALFAGDTRSLRTRDDDPRCQKLKPDIVITDLLQLTEFISAPHTSL